MTVVITDRPQVVPLKGLQLTLPLPPNIANGRFHWRDEHRVKLAFWAVCDIAVTGATDGDGIQALRRLVPMVARLEKRPSRRALAAELTRLTAAAATSTPNVRIRPPAIPWDHVVLAAELHLGAPMDMENAKFRAYKWPSDWLRSRGFIADDRASRCLMREPGQRVSRTARYQLVLTITQGDA